MCGSLNWAGDAIIGFNAAADFYENHYLSGLPVSNSIACVHSNSGSEWNNVIYNLVPVPGQFTGMTTPEPPTSIGEYELCVRLVVTIARGKKKR